MEVTVFSWNTNGIMNCAWMLYTVFLRNGIMNWGMGALGTVFSWNTNGIMNWHGCFSHFNLFWNTNGIRVWTWMLSVTVFTRNTNGIVV